MRTTYRIHARCVRSFTSWIEIEADTPNQAVAKARLEETELVAAADDCDDWPWDEFTVYDDNGNILLHVPDQDARLRDAALTLLETLDYVRATLKLRHIDEATDAEVDEALAMADKAIAQVRDAKTSATV